MTATAHRPISHESHDLTLILQALEFRFHLERVEHVFWHPQAYQSGFRVHSARRLGEIIEEARYFLGTHAIGAAMQLFRPLHQTLPVP